MCKVASIVKCLVEVKVLDNSELGGGTGWTRKDWLKTRWPEIRCCSSSWPCAGLDTRPLPCAAPELDHPEAVFQEDGQSQGWAKEKLPSLTSVEEQRLHSPSFSLSSECWNFHCSSVFQPVNTQIFHPSWGSSFGTAFLWRSLELIILYFILLYKQQSRKETTLGGQTNKTAFSC